MIPPDGGLSYRIWLIAVVNAGIATSVLASEALTSARQSDVKYEACGHCYHKKALEKERVGCTGIRSHVPKGNCYENGI
jgi:hypothetical protein